MLPPPSGEAALTIAILSIVSTLALSVSVVYTASPFSMVDPGLLLGGTGFGKRV
jgi:hypothetical protein